MAAKKIRIYYRAPSHVPLWKVMEECGFMEKHGLAMEMGSLEGQRKRAAEGLKAGDLDIVSGNHHTLYARVSCASASPCGTPKSATATRAVSGGSR